MSDFLAEIEARRDRAPRRDLPIAAVVTGLTIALAVPLFLTALTVKAAEKVIGGLAATGDLGLYATTVAGIALGLAAVVWAVFYFASVRLSRPDWGLKFFGALAAVAFVATAGSSAWAGFRADRETQEKVAIVEIRESLQLFLRDNLKTDAKIAPMKARGRVGRVEAQVKADMAEVLRLQRKYEADLKAIDTDGLDRTGFTRADIKEVADRFTRAQALTKAHRAALKAQLTTTRKRFVASGFTPWLMRAYLPDFETEWRLKQGRRDRLLHLQEQRMETNHDQLMALYNSYGRWRLGARGPLFERMADYNAVTNAAAQVQYFSWRIATDRAADQEMSAAFQQKLEAASEP